MLPQTKRHKDQLVELGFDRSNLSVQTPCNNKGEYQKTKIHHWCPDKKIIDKAEELVNAGYIVHKITDDGTLKYASIVIPDYDEEPHIHETELSAVK